MRPKILKVDLLTTTFLRCLVNVLKVPRDTDWTLGCGWRLHKAEVRDYMELDIFELGWTYLISPPFTCMESLHLELMV